MARATADEPVGPRGNVGAYVMAFIALVISLVAWAIASGASNKANEAVKTANHALSVSQTTENTVGANANDQASTGAGTGTNNPVMPGGTTQPNGNGQ